MDFNDQDELRKVVITDMVNTGILFFDKYHLSTSGERMHFNHMPYLKEMYFDESQEIIVMSSVQTGKSEFALIKGLASVDSGLNVFHVFSTGEAKNSFVKSRIDELFDKVPEYKVMEKDDRRNKYLRQIGEANWKFVISGSKPQFDEFPADIIIVDEFDSCNQENVKLADTRTENSNYKIKLIVGNPTVENVGIEELWKESTKKEWYFLCKECKEWIGADFFKIVVKENKDNDGNHLTYELYDTEWNENLYRDIYIRCPHCKTLQDRGKGKWIKEGDNFKRTSYHISKIMKLNSKISELWIELKDAEGNDYKTMIFYNKKLGLPYTGTGAKITKDMLDRLVYDYVVRNSSRLPTIGGLDVGEKFDLQIDISAKKEGKRKRLFLNAYRLNSLEEVKEKIELFNIKTLCVGIKPERHLMQKLREDMFGICDVILIEELEGKSGNLKLIGFEENEELGVIKTDRTWMLDESMKNIKMKLNILPKGYESILDGFWLKSMESITRIFENDKNEYKWSKASIDHFRFTDAFSMLAWMKTQDAILFGGNFKKDETEKKSKRDIEVESKKLISRKITHERIGLVKRNYGLRRR